MCKNRKLAICHSFSIQTLILKALIYKGTFIINESHTNIKKQKSNKTNQIIKLERQNSSEPLTISNDIFIFKYAERKVTQE